MNMTYVWEHLKTTFSDLNLQKKYRKRFEHVTENQNYRLYQKNVIYDYCEDLPSRTIMKRLMLWSNKIGLTSPPETR